MLDCPLCKISGTLLYVDAVTSKGYVHCRGCDLRFLRASDRLSLDAEQAHYEHHNNDVDDFRYQAFVSPACDEIRKRVSVGASGLDFGCGPASAAAKLLRDCGYKVELYDPIFLPDARALERDYDFVVATEVVEHFFAPLAEFQKLHGLLKVGGALVVMTLLVSDEVDFDRWYYRIDPTHVAFYSAETFDWIMNQTGFSCVEIISPRVVVLTK